MMLARFGRVARGAGAASLWSALTPAIVCLVLVISSGAAVAGMILRSMEKSMEKSMENMSFGAKRELGKQTVAPVVRGAPVVGSSGPQVPAPVALKQRRYLITARSQKDADALIGELRGVVPMTGGYLDKIVYAETQNPEGLLAHLARNPKVAFVEEWSEIGRAPIVSPPTMPFNLNAEQTHNVEALRKQYGISGRGISVGLWDEGPALNNHVEFAGRLDVRDAGLPHPHATHVAGTIAAQGVERRARGMAPDAKIVSYDWNDDLLKLKTASSGPQRIQITNHSYGRLRGWSHSASLGSWIWHGDPNVSQSEDYLFGKYVTHSSSIDEMISANPELNVFVSAGNERSARNDPNRIPDWDGRHLVRLLDEYVTLRRPPNFQHEGYDTLEGYGVAKNVITVGAIEDIPFGVTGMPASAVRVTAFSSWGPPDDGRVKPDVVANGAKLYSPSVQRIPGGFNNRFYATMSGTSMATPAAAGIAALLSELSQQRRNGKNIRADEMKAVLIQTAVSPDAGPNYQIGWGAIDALAAGQLIAGDSQALLTDHVKAGGDGVLRAKGTDRPIRVTLTWIDPPALPHDGKMNDRRPALVHNLDLVLKDQNNKRYYPWSLNPDEPTAPATRSRPNELDNVERVDVENPGPPGTWTIEVIGPEAALGHPFALAISGLELLQ